jgi:hypothetical protein
MSGVAGPRQDPRSRRRSARLEASGPVKLPHSPSMCSTATTIPAHASRRTSRAETEGRAISHPGDVPVLPANPRGRQPRNAQLAFTASDQLAIFDALATSIIREAACRQAARKAWSLLVQLSLYLASFHFDARLPRVDGRFPWVARRRTNTGCPRDQALSRSRTAILPGGSARRPKPTESRKPHACSPPTTACLFPTMSAVSRRPA